MQALRSAPDSHPEHAQNSLIRRKAFFGQNPIGPLGTQESQRSHFPTPHNRTSPHRLEHHRPETGTLTSGKLFLTAADIGSSASIAYRDQNIEESKQRATPSPLTHLHQGSCFSQRLTFKVQRALALCNPDKKGTSIVLPLPHWRARIRKVAFGQRLTFKVSRGPFAPLKRCPSPAPSSLHFRTR